MGGFVDCLTRNQLQWLMLLFVLSNAGHESLLCLAGRCVRWNNSVSSLTWFSSFTACCVRNRNTGSYFFPSLSCLSFLSSCFWLVDLLWKVWGTKNSSSSWLDFTTTWSEWDPCFVLCCAISKNLFCFSMGILNRTKRSPFAALRRLAINVAVAQTRENFRLSPVSFASEFARLNRSCSCFSQEK